MITALLPWPPSTNHYFGERVGSSKKTHTNIVFKYVGLKGKKYRNEVSMLFKRTGLKLTEGHVVVKLGYFVPDKRKRDLDNLHKCLLDAIVQAGMIADDSMIVRLISNKYERDMRLPRGGVVVQIASVPGWCQPSTSELECLEGLTSKDLK